MPEPLASVGAPTGNPVERAAPSFPHRIRRDFRAQKPLGVFMQDPIHLAGRQAQLLEIVQFFAGVPHRVVASKQHALRAVAADERARLAGESA